MTTESSGSSTSSDRQSRRKALIVRTVHPIPGLPGYDEKASAYWQAARQHVSRQELSLGNVASIFAESVIGHGEDGMLALHQVNPLMHRFVKSFTDAGAKLAPFEDPDLLNESADWSQCLNIPFRSEKVHGHIGEQFSATIEARNAHLQAVLDASIGATDVALILMTSESLPLPSDVDRYIVSPPELDQLDRWLREQLAKAQQEYMQAAQAEADATRGGRSQEPSAGGGLWTPP